MYDNYMKLTPQQKEFLRAVGRAPIILRDPQSPQGHVTHTADPATTQVVAPSLYAKVESQRQSDGIVPSDNPTQKN